MDRGVTGDAHEERRQATLAPLRIHRRAMMEALLDRLAEDPDTAGLRLPHAFDYAPTTWGNATVTLATRLDGQPARTRTMERCCDPERPEEIAPAALDDLVRHARFAMYEAVASHAADDAPAWAVLVHPVLLAMLLSHEPRREAMPIGWASGGPGRTDRWDVDHDGQIEHGGVNGTVASGDCSLGSGTLVMRRMGVVLGTPGRGLSSVTMECVPARGTSVSVAGIVPQTALASIPGRTLGQVLGLPTSGHADVDAAAAAIVVKAVEELPNGMTLTFERTRFIPYGIAPDDATRRAMALVSISG